MSGFQFGAVREVDVTVDGVSNDVAVDAAGQSFTVRLFGVLAEVATGRTGPLVATTHSLVIPVDGRTDHAKIQFGVNGYGTTRGNGRGYVVLDVNGQSAVRSFSADADDEYVLTLNFAGPLTTACQITVTLIAEAAPSDEVAPSDEDADSHVDVVNIHGLILDTSTAGPGPDPAGASTAASPGPQPV